VLPTGLLPKHSVHARCRQLRLLIRLLTGVGARAQMANPSVGVIGIEWRPVPCTFQPANDLGPIGTPPGYPSSSYCAFQ